MNKQELIKELKDLEYHNARKRQWVDRGLVLELVEQLDEPQPLKLPVVPQFVADWYEVNKDDFEGALFRCIDCIPGLYDEEELNDFEEWVVDSGTKPFQTLVNMHQFGYEIEQGKRYLVNLKNGQPLVKAPIGGNFYFNQNITTEKCKVTRKELEEARFGWVFDCPGVEIEEVEG